MGHLWAKEVYLLLKKKGYISVTPRFYGGGLRIRTLGGDKPSTVFKTAAFDHSASPPETFF